MRKKSRKMRIGIANKRERERERVFRHFEHLNAP